MAPKKKTVFHRAQHDPSYPHNGLWGTKAVVTEMSALADRGGFAVIIGTVPRQESFVAGLRPSDAASATVFGI